MACCPWQRRKALNRHGARTQPDNNLGEEAMSKLGTLKDNYVQGRLNRRQFMEGAFALGLSVPAALSMSNAVLAATPKKGGRFGAPPPPPPQAPGGGGGSIHAQPQTPPPRGPSGRDGASQNSLRGGSRNPTIFSYVGILGVSKLQKDVRIIVL